MIEKNFLKNEMKTITSLILLAVLKLSIPALVIFLLVWQSVDHAHLNRQIKKLSQKKEDLYKKNYELKVRIASFASAERMESIYKKNNQTTSFSSKKIITLILPPESKDFEIYK